MEPTEAKKANSLAKKEAKLAKEANAAAVKPEVKIEVTPVKEEKTSAKIPIPSTKKTKSAKKYASDDRVDIIRNLCDQSDFCYNGQVSVEVTA